MSIGRLSVPIGRTNFLHAAGAATGDLMNCGSRRVLPLAPFANAYSVCGIVDARFRPSSQTFTAVRPKYQAGLGAIFAKRGSNSALIFSAAVDVELPAVPGRPLRRVIE